MYKSYSYNNMPQPVIRNKKNENRKPCQDDSKDNSKKIFPLFFNKMELDDIILIAVIFILFMNECDDMLLLAVLGFIFLSEFADIKT